jgi:hypothetical protein
MDIVIYTIIIIYLKIKEIRIKYKLDLALQCIFHCDTST